MNWKKWALNVLRAFCFGLICAYSFGFIALGLWLRQYGDITVELVGWHVAAAMGMVSLKVIVFTYLAFHKEVYEK